MKSKSSTIYFERRLWLASAWSLNESSPSKNQSAHLIVKVHREIIAGALSKSRWTLEEQRIAFVTKRETGETFDRNAWVGNSKTASCRMWIWGLFFNWTWWRSWQKYPDEIRVMLCKTANLKFNFLHKHTNTAKSKKWKE